MSKYQKIIDLRNMYLIKKSGFFDDKYYKLEYPEVTGNRLKHYYYEGYKKGYNPSSKFDNDFYLTNNSDVYNAGINPLLHYVVSGRSEGRQIKKVSGVKISTAYSMLEQTRYSFRSLLDDDNSSRLTIFFTDEKYLDILFKIIKKCFNVNVRIMYSNIDFSKLEKFIRDNSINMNNIDFIKLDSHYYFKFRLNEKIICFDYMILNSLLHTLYIKYPIYYYIDKNIDTKSNDYKWLSYYVSKNQVLVVNDSDIAFDNYQLIVHNNLDHINQEVLKVGLQFDNLCIPMLQVMEDYFIKNNLDYKVNFFYSSDDFHKTISFIDDERIKSVLSLDDVDVIVRFSYEKQDFGNEKNLVSIYFDKCDDKLPIFSIDMFCDKVGDDNV